METTTLQLVDSPDAINFENANLTGAKLTSANLRNGNFKKANLTNADFSKSDLQGAQFDFSVLLGTNFESANLANATFSNGVKNETAAIEKPYEQLKKMAFYDVITGVYNRQAFEEFFEKELTNMWRYEYDSAVFLIDLDHFKTVNDTYGHLMGDALLKEAAIRLQKIIRQGDLIARFGGDEFAVFFKNIGTEVDPGNMAQKIIDLLSAPYHLNQIIATISASIGICYWQANSALTSKDILSRADIALYRAKSEGRNNYQYYSKFLHRKHQQHIAFKKEVEYSVKNDGIELSYQPILIKDYVTVGFATTLRCKIQNEWITDSVKILQTISDATLIEILIKKILQESFLFLSHHNKLALYLKLPLLHLAHENFFTLLDACAIENDIQLCQINIEISELQFKTDDRTLKNILDQLTKRNIPIVIHHFSGNHLSLVALKQSPISKIKIAPTLIEQLDCDQHKQIIVQSIIQLAHGLNMYCIGDGVSHLLQAETLLKMDCDALQGEYFK